MNTISDISSCYQVASAACILYLVEYVVSYRMKGRKADIINLPHLSYDIGMCKRVVISWIFKLHRPSTTSLSYDTKCFDSEKCF